MGDLKDRKRVYHSVSSSTTSSTDRPTIKKAKSRTAVDESHQKVGAKAARTEEETENTHEAESAKSKKVKVRLIVTVPSGTQEEERDEEGKDEEGKDEEGKDEEGKDEEGKDEEGKDEEGKDEEGKDEEGKDEEEEGEQEPEQPTKPFTKNLPSFHETFPGMPAPNLANAYRIPLHIQGRLMPTDPILDAQQRAKDDAHTLSGRRSLWATVIAAAKKQGMTKEQWKGDYFEDMDLTSFQLHRVVVMEEQERVKGKQREPSYHIESDEEEGQSD